MTKKHFIALAALMVSLKPSGHGIHAHELTHAQDNGKLEQWRKTLVEMADFLAEQNPNFNKTKWLSAAGL